MLKIYPYKIGSESARDLARALRVKRIVPEGRYAPSRHSTVVVNWGCSEMHFNHSNIINKPESVRVAANKLATFQKLQQSGVSIPEFTTDNMVAAEWQEDGFRVVCRMKLSAHSGEGIQICQPMDNLPYAPLYTKYTKKDQEFRVHVFQGRVIDWSEKCRRSGVEPTNTLVRNHANGWVFCREGRTLPDQARDQAVKAVQALGLDFGAVDVISREGNKAWVLEINTAPGLEGSSLQAYIREFRRYA